MNVKSTKKKNQVITANIFEQQELLESVHGIGARCQARETVYKYSRKRLIFSR